MNEGLLFLSFFPPNAPPKFSDQNGVLLCHLWTVKTDPTIPFYVQNRTSYARATADELAPFILVEIAHFLDWFGFESKGKFGEIASI